MTPGVATSKRTKARLTGFEFTRMTACVPRFRTGNWLVVHASPAVVIVTAAEAAGAAASAATRATSVALRAGAFAI